ncbi:MAG: hypothetical protein V4649_00605 [Bacteroidota bacterium]
MKKALLVFLVCLSATAGKSQVTYGYKSYLVKPTRISLFGGAGLATSNNYDVGVSAGLDFQKWIQDGTYLGFVLFLQGYSLLYDNEANSTKHGVGTSGFILRHDSKYVFFSPKIQRDLWTKPNFFTAVYVTGGAGFKMSGYDSVRKWDHGFGPTYPGYYDSTIDASKNLNSMLLRVGFGFTQDIYVGRHLFFTLREDFGFLYGGLTQTGEADNNNPSKMRYSPNRINPGYISLQLGLTYIKGKKEKQ